jgi:hypothetical protein
MRILLGAQSCGFGPASKLTAISRALSGHHRVCVGVTVAEDFARYNAEAFDEIVEANNENILAAQVRDAHWVISVMDADLVFRAAAGDRPALLVDSLLAFWELGQPAEKIAALVEQARRTGFGNWEQDLAELSPHERIYAAHMVADASMAQVFPGTAERAATLNEAGAANVFLTGPIVDETGLADVPHEGDGADLLVNTGGFKNFLLDYESHNTYLGLMARWIPDLLSDWPHLTDVMVCGGSYGGHRATSVGRGSRTALFRCLPQRSFIHAVASARHYLATPGLTAIHEALQIGQLPMALPEQHYGHISNLAGLRGTLFERHGSRFAELIEDYQVPAGDWEGTAAIVRQVGQVVEDETAYTRFRRGMNERLESYMALDATARGEGVAELRSLLRGPSFSALLTELIPVSPPNFSRASVERHDGLPGHAGRDRPGTHPAASTHRRGRRQRGD